MRMALQLAARARGATRPNPMVGAVVVRGGRVVGSGYHRRAGQPHAEILALSAAGARARGATLYVTLEPCRHFGRTPPCVPAILASGIRRVVVAMADPNPQMRGQSLRRLRAAGVETRAGVLAQEAQALNEVYVTWRRKHRPFVTVKVAHSLDGKIATRTGQSHWPEGRGAAISARRSQWIASPAARRYVHVLRRQVDAIMVGVGTVLADDPRLTVRTRGSWIVNRGSKEQPLRVVVDSRLRTPPTARLFQGAAPVLIATTASAPVARRRALEAKGAEVRIFPRRGGGVDLRALLETLARRQVTHLLVEGGGTLIAGFLEARLVDRWISIVAPRLIGGRAAPTAVEGAGVGSVHHAVPLHEVTWSRLGGDFIIRGRLKRCQAPSSKWCLAP